VRREIKSVTIEEKEKAEGRFQTNHNSPVFGVWYHDDEEEDEAEHGAREHDVLRRGMEYAKDNTHYGRENDQNADVKG
jgi:hypothetical protein